MGHLSFHSSLRREGTTLQSHINQESRIDLANRILEAKARKGLSFQEPSNCTRLSLAFVTAALLGQHALPGQAARVVGEKLELDENAVALLQTIPWRIRRVARER